MKKILFITSGSIGDAIISTGILNWLAGTYPDARFTIAAGVASAPLFTHFPPLERLLPVHKLPHNRHWLKLWQETRHTRWDLVVDLRGSLLSYLIPARQRRIFHSPDKSESKAMQLARLFYLPSPPPTCLWPSPEARAKAAALLPAGRQIIVLAPKTNSIAKDWPIERFGDTARQLAGEKTVFAILASEAQRESVSSLANTLPPGTCLDLSGQTDLLTAIAVIEASTLFIGNDSGLLHMAAAVRTPCVGIYGPSNDKTYAPRSPTTRILTAHTFQPGEPEKKDASYMLKISVAEVVGAARELLASTAKESDIGTKTS